MCPRTGTARPKVLACTRSRIGSRCCTALMITPRSSWRRRCTTQCTPGARIRSPREHGREPQMPLVKSGFIPIAPGPRPGFDHADIYRDSSGASRWYVAHTAADRVDVIDCQAGAYLRAVPGHPGVAGVLIDSGQDLLFTSDREAGQVGVYRCSDEKLLARLNVGAHPNGLAFDPGRRRLFSFNLGEPIGENCTASVSDIGQPEVIATIRLPSRPLWAAYDPATDQVYVNIRDPAQILAIAARSLTITCTIVVPSAGPHVLWIDG